jgi:hypothetical protein
MEERLKEFRRRVSTNTNPGKVVDPGPESKGGKLAPETLSFYPKGEKELLFLKYLAS